MAAKKEKAKKPRKKKVEEAPVEDASEDAVPVEDASTGEVEVLNPNETINPDAAPRPKKKLLSTDGTTDVPAKPHKNVAKDPDKDHETRRWFRVVTTRWSPPTENLGVSSAVYNRGDIVFLTPREASWAFTHRKIKIAAPSEQEERDALKSQAHIS